MSIVFEFMQVVKKWQKYIVYDGVIPPSLVSIWNNQTTHIMWNMFVSFCGLSSSSSCHVQFMGLISFQLQISTNFQRLWKGSNYHTLFNKDLPFTLSNEAAEFEIILLNQKITTTSVTGKLRRFGNLGPLFNIQYLCWLFIKSKNQGHFWNPHDKLISKLSLHTRFGKELAE